MPVSVSVVKKNSGTEVMRFDISQDLTDTGKLSKKMAECIEHAMGYVTMGDKGSVIIVEYREDFA